VNFLEEEALAGRNGVFCVGLSGSQYHMSPLEEVLRSYDAKHERPQEQWWMELRSIARLLAQPGPHYHREAGGD